MKKFYTVILLLLVSYSIAISQVRYWVGPPPPTVALWSSPANWSTSSGGAGGSSVPNSSSFDVIFDRNALVNLDVPGLVLHSIRVTNSSTTTIFTSVGNTIHVTSSTIGNEAL